MVVTLLAVLAFLAATPAPGPDEGLPPPEARMGEIVLGGEEAFLDLEADVGTVYDLSLDLLQVDRTLMPDGVQADTWLVVDDVWLRLEPLPYRSGEWTRVRVRVGEFDRPEHQTRARELLSGVAARYSELRGAERRAYEASRAGAGQSRFSESSALPWAVTHWTPYDLLWLMQWFASWQQPSANVIVLEPVVQTAYVYQDSWGWGWGNAWHPWSPWSPWTDDDWQGHVHCNTCGCEPEPQPPLVRDDPPAPDDGESRGVIDGRGDLGNHGDDGGVVRHDPPRRLNPRIAGWNGSDLTERVPDAEATRRPAPEVRPWAGALAQGGGSANSPPRDLLPSSRPRSIVLPSLPSGSSRSLGSVGPFVAGGSDSGGSGSSRVGGSGWVFPRAGSGDSSGASRSFTGIASGSGMGAPILTPRATPSSTLFLPPRSTGASQPSFPTPSRTVPAAPPRVTPAPPRVAPRPPVARPPSGLGNPALGLGGVAPRPVSVARPSTPSVTPSARSESSPSAPTPPRSSGRSRGRP